MIKAIIFDCFGVLTTDTWRAFTASLPKEVDVDAAREVHRAYDSGLISKQESAKQIIQITGREFVELEDIIDPKTIKEDRVIELIKDLKPKYKIGLLSNVGNNWINENLLSADEQKLFDSMVFSYQAGMVKPNPEIFLLACEKLKVSPNEAIMVDDVDRYCEAARDLGMQSIQYETFEEFKKQLDKLLSANMNN